MCVIVMQPKGAHLKKERAKRLWQVNPDGGGFAFIDDDNEIQGFKSMEFQEFWNAFEGARKAFPKRDYLIHMRIATHGTVDIDNVHPFRIGDDEVMAHNGIMHKVPDDKEKKKSDTRMFIEEILPQLPNLWLDTPLMVDMVGDWIGWSKLAFLTTNPEYEFSWYIVNESKGEWVDKMWFSSSSGVRPRPKYQTVTPIYQKGKRQTTPSVRTPMHYGDQPLSMPSEDDDLYLGHSRKAAPPFGDGWGDDELLKEYEALAVPLGNAIDLTKDEADVFLELLIDDRSAMGLTKTIIWNPDDAIIDCYGCDEEVSLDTGACSCWDKFCMDCDNIAGLCECKDGYSSNLKLWSEMPDRKE